VRNGAGESSKTMFEFGLRFVGLGYGGSQVHSRAFGVRVETSRESPRKSWRRIFVEIAVAWATATVSSMSTRGTGACMKAQF
jgi:hypothetical protein